MEFIFITIILFVLLLLSKERRRVTQLKEELTEALSISQTISGSTGDYFFILDSALSVKATNYGKLAQKFGEELHPLGNFIECTNAKKAGVCGEHANCINCAIRKELLHCINSGEAVSQQTSVITINEELQGEIAYNLRFSARKTIVNKEEQLILSVHQLEEVTQVKKALVHSNKRLACFFDNISIGCAICNSSGEIIDTNSAYLDILGVNSKEEVLNQLNIFNDPCINPEFKEMIRQGVPVLGELKYDYKKLNSSYITSKQSGVHYYRFVTNYTFTSEGAVDECFLMLLENTDIHLLLRQNKMFNDLINHASSVSNTGFCSFNLLKDEQLVTAQYLKNLGFAEDEELLFTHTNSLITIHPEDLFWIDNYLASAKKGVVAPVEKKIRIFKEGKYEWIKQYFIQQKYEAHNGIITICGVNIDINAQIEIEQELTEAKNRAESSDRLKTAFLANVSHEIRTPLNAIVGFSELMIDSDTKEDMDVYKLIIRENTHLLLKLVKDILDLSKIEAGTLEYSWKDVNLNDILADLYHASVSKEVGKKEVEIYLEPSLERCIIHTEPTRITQVLKHFMDNAFKFTNQGSITLGYTIDKDIYIYVKDTGCGIPKEMQQEIFERFVKLNHFEQGTGLGLSICSSIIQTMGGSIGVDSEPGKGATFWCRLPIKAKQLSFAQTERYA